MNDVTITRDTPLSDCILGVVDVRGSTFYSLELPWRNNRKNFSCIPVGEYICKFREKTGTHKNVYEITGVSGRKNILIHAGNYPRESRGCILLGIGRITTGSGMVTQSRMAIRDFNNLMDKKDFLLVIKEVTKTSKMGNYAG